MLTLHPPPLHCAAPENISPPQYKSAVSKATFFLAPKPSTFEAAEQACQMGGGHLAAFTSGAEQTEVEKFFTDSGYWFPTNFKFYWMGLKAINWPTFAWTDKMVPGPNATSYRHWGTYIDKTLNIGEPYSVPGAPQQQCAGGNFTQMYGNAAGWADEDCGDEHLALCKVQRGWLQPALPGLSELDCRVDRPSCLKPRVLNTPRLDTARSRRRLLLHTRH